MADLLCIDTYVPISHIGCGMTKRALLGLEPGSENWLKIEGTDLLFERVQHGPDGRITRGLKVVGSSSAAWQRIYDEHRGSVVELTFTERPIDAGRSSERWRDDDLSDRPAKVLNTGVYNG